MKLLTGDIGGTNTRLAVYDLAKGRFVDGAARVYPSPGHASLAAILEQFRGEYGAAIEAGCFAVAGSGMAAARSPICHGLSMPPTSARHSAGGTSRCSTIWRPLPGASMRWMTVIGTV
jgi:predicted NBD/HSP70 family sugar kinase